MKKEKLINTCVVECEELMSVTFYNNVMKQKGNQMDRQQGNGTNIRHGKRTEGVYGERNKTKKKHV